MRVQALRGVCVGVGQNMKGPTPEYNPDGVLKGYKRDGEIRDLDDATANYLKAIKAVEDAPAERPSTSVPEASGGKSK